MSVGRLSVRQVAERLGEDVREVRAELIRLHEEHGGLLRRRTGGRNTKWWVDEVRAYELIPRLGRAPTERDIAILHSRVDRVEMLTERSLQRLGQVERKLRE